MAEHGYRLVLRWILGEVLSPEQEEIYDAFIGKYGALITGNEEKERTTLHFSSPEPLKQSDLEKELKGLDIIDFYEVE